MASRLSPQVPGPFPQPREVLKGGFCMLSTPPPSQLELGVGAALCGAFSRPLLLPLSGVLEGPKAWSRTGQPFKKDLTCSLSWTQLSEWATPGTGRILSPRRSQAGWAGCEGHGVRGGIHSHKVSRDNSLQGTGKGGVGIPNGGGCARVSCGSRPHHGVQAPASTLHPFHFPREQVRLEVPEDGGRPCPHPQG